MARARAQALPLRGLSLVGREIWAGIAVIAAALPSCLAAGVLAFGPLGPSYVAQGVAAGLCSAIREVNAVMIPNGQKDQTKTNIGRFAGLLDR